MMRLRLIRHPETSFDVAPERYQGWLDIPLDEAGKAEAKVVRDKVTAACRIDAVYSSDMSRALTVGRLVADECGLTLTPTFTLRGWNLGDELSGQQVGAVEGQVDYLVHQGRNLTPPGGESFQRFLGRFLGSLEGILGAAGHEGVAVTHQRNLEIAHAWVERGRPAAETFPSDYYDGEPMPLSAMLTLERGGDGRWGSAGVIALGAAPIPEGVAW